MKNKIVNKVLDRMTSTRKVICEVSDTCPTEWKEVNDQTHCVEHELSPECEMFCPAQFNRYCVQAGKRIKNEGRYADLRQGI